MLAERRKKVFYSNPRGTLWANDAQKFGQKMLKTMGWKEGKGLGRNEDGITENVKASFKFDSQGFGYKRKLSDWIEENNVYEQILSDLAQHHSGSEAVASKQADKDGTGQSDSKVKSSVKHHHRSKFIRAKKQSMQSQKDLFCIFPTTTKADKTKDSANQKSSNSEITESEQADEAKCAMVTVESKLSIEDYFKQKMQSKLQKTDSSASQSVIAESSVTPLTDSGDVAQVDAPHVPTTKHRKKKHKQKKSLSK